jgi:type II secretory pathway pseudopilin PulG
MIELIFVIVIIGILAAVAIPKLSATRDDAKISNIVANARTALSDMTSAYTSLGRPNFAAKDIVAITNVPFKLTNCAGSQVTAGTAIAGQTMVLCDSSVECVRFVVDANATQVDITATTNAASPVCTGVQTDPAIISMAGATSGTAKTQTFGGASVNRN